MSSTATTWGVDINTDASSTSAPTWEAGSDIATTWGVDINTDAHQPYGKLALSSGWNYGSNYLLQPTGFIYGTQAIHGMSVEDLGIAIPELLGISSSTNAAVNFGGNWFGSLSTINIYNTSLNLAVDYKVGYEIFSLRVSEAVNTELFYSPHYYLQKYHRISTWAEGSDIATTWEVDVEST